VSGDARPTHIRIVPPPAPRRGGEVSPAVIRRAVEQLLAGHPHGLPWRVLWEEIALRRRALGAPVPRRDDLVRVLGDLLVAGRVDERAGRFVLLAVGRGTAERLSA